jgi:hypothetical protein
MDMKFWTSALKYHTPATISGFVFYKLATSLLASDNLLLQYPNHALVIFLIIANFCAFLLWRSTDTSKNTNKQTTISGNKVNNNEVGKDLEISTPNGGSSEQNVNIEKNELSGNRVKGGLFIGGKTKK